MNDLEPMTFLDIEPPLHPGTDWSVWMEASLAVLVALAVLLLLVWLAWRTYRPWALAWRLRRMQAACLVMSEPTVSKQCVWQLYLLVKPWQNKVPQDAATAEALQVFWRDLNHAAFSSASVSRETYAQLLTQAQKWLPKTQQAGWQKGLGGLPWKP